MKNLERLTFISMILGIITLISLFLSLLALTDIFHDTESNLNVEWNIVRANYLFSLIFIVLSLITIWKLSK